MKWFRGDISILYSTQAPKDHEKIVVQTEKDSAILTWFELHQKKRYLHDLGLEPQSFEGKLLDVGSGPFPGGMAFENCMVYCLDPLLPRYLDAGFPIHYYEKARFVCGYAEAIPVDDNFFDAVISVNAIDHVADLSKASMELSRVCKPNCRFAMHVHYHKPSTTEPIAINDEIFQYAFSWVHNLKKVSESKSKMDNTVADSESYVLWRNF